LGQLTNTITVEIRLSYNQLEGEIPASLTNLKLERFDVEYNMLTASDPDVIALLNSLNPGWENSQTVPPTNVQVSDQTSTTVRLTWSPILYQAHGGHYQVGYTQQPTIPYQIHGNTPDKTANSYTATNLCPGKSYRFGVRTYTPEHLNQLSALYSLYSPEVRATLAPRQVNLLLLPILALDSNLDKYYAELVAGIQEATARDTRIMALVLADRSNVTDTHILKIQCGQIEPLSGLPSLDQPPDTLDASLHEYDMTNPSQLAAFIRWARTTLGKEQPAGDHNSIKTVLSYIGHGLPLAPATDISGLIKKTADTLQPASVKAIPNGLPPAPTKIPATPDQLTDQTSFTLISPYSLTQALVLATNNGANPITVLDIVHCFGGTIEELYELSNPQGQPVVDVVVASPNYTYVGPTIFTQAMLGLRPEHNATGMGINLVRAYETALSEADGFDDEPETVDHPRIVVAVDMSKVAEIKRQVDALAVGVMISFTQFYTDTKIKLWAAHEASIHYDTIPGNLTDNDNLYERCPQDFTLTAHDGLSDLGSFAQQMAKQFTGSLAVNEATTKIGPAIDSAVITSTIASGNPWFADNPKPFWDFSQAKGIALYTDFHGVTISGTTYIGWQAHWYTNTVSADNPYPFAFVQGEMTWADVIQRYWADQLGSSGIKTVACVTLLPQVRLRALYLPLIRK
jgi:hypothetical protein